MNKVLFILLVVVSIISFHCQKEVSYVNVAGNQNGFLPAITLQGNVLDENGQPAVGVAIKVREKTTITDARGYFRVSNASAIEKNVLVTAEKPGYFKAYRSFIPTNGVSQVMIKLTRKDLSGQINSSIGGDVTLSNGSKITLPANGVVTASGGSYAGPINVYAAYIDPTSKDISAIIPGSLTGDNKDSKRVTLTSYGMLGVQLESPIGEKLQMASGSTAVLTFFIPPSIQSTAPASISLWYIDEQTGIWKEDGTAAKNGNEYVGVVKHFSFWNCDIGTPGVKLSLTLQSPKGSPLVYTLVRLTTAGGRASLDYTDSLGQVSGLVPADTALTMEVISYACNEVIYSKNIGPFNQSTDLGIITVDNSQSISTIHGRLLNCSNSPVPKGYAMIYYYFMVNNAPVYYMMTYIPVDKRGNFSSDVVVCGGNVVLCQVLGVDDEAKRQSLLVNFNLTRTETNVGDISVCGSPSEQFINYTLDGVDHSLTSDASDSLYGHTLSWGYTNIGGFNNTDRIGFDYEDTSGAGTFPLGKLFVTPYDDSAVIVLPHFDITITNHPQNPGEFYEGHFSGQFTHYTTGAMTHNISCLFRVRR